MELFEPPPPFHENPHADAQLESSYRNLDRVLGQVTMADNKALIALQFQGAIVAGLALLVVFLRDALTGSHANRYIAAGIFVLLMAFFVCFAWATIRLFQTISPRIARTGHHDEHPSWLFFFGGIAELDSGEFARRMRGLSPEDIHEGISVITHTNSKIVQQKFFNLRQAYFFLGAQIVLYVLILLLSVLRV